MSTVKYDRNSFYYFLIGIFVIISLTGLYYHEPWGDEAQAWLIARDCPDIISVIMLMGYEGSPGLWHMMLFSLAKTGLPYISMSIVHMLIALCIAVIFVKYSPFTTLEKSLFIFGYFILYEYNAIARSYALSVLFLFLIALMYKERFNHSMAYASLIALLANTNLHSLAFAVVLSAFYAYEIFERKKVAAWKHLLPAILIFILGISISVLQLLPALDREVDGGTITSRLDFSPYHIGQMFNAAVEAFLPVPKLMVNFWGSKFLYYPSEYLAILGLPVFLLTLTFFLKKPVPMLIYLMSALCLLVIFFIANPGSIRHHGLLYIMFIFCLWISNSYGDRPVISSRMSDRLFSKKNLSLLLIALLSVHVVASAVALYYEINYDFSQGRKVADFLKDNGYIDNDTFIATYRTGTDPILPYIDYPYSKFFSIEDEDYRSYIIWDRKYCMCNITASDIMDRIDNATMDKQYTSRILIVKNRINDSEFNDRYSLIAAFNESIANEPFYIYRSV